MVSWEIHKATLNLRQPRIYDAKTKTYESDRAYEKRISDDLKKNIDTFKANGIRAPRVMVWPYGRYNMETVRIAKNWVCQLPLHLMMVQIM
jgi:hypothetical protein